MNDFIFSLDNVTLTMSKVDILKGIDWTVRKGEHWAVLGVNGSGKSSLFRVVAGELWPDIDLSRTYCFDGSRTHSPIEAMERIRLVSPEQQDIFYSMGWLVSGQEAVLAGKDNTPFLYRLADDREYSQVREFMASLGMDDLADKNILTMSRGEARKVLIARALIAKPDVLILDEFMEGIDQDSREIIFAAVEKAAAEGTTIICSAHRSKELPPCINRTLGISGGRITCADMEDSEAVCTLPEFEVPEPPEISKVEPDTVLFRIKDSNVILLGKQILTGINWEVRGDENWALLGRNGAGKTTLMKLLNGDLPPYAGGGVERLPEKGGCLSEVRSFFSYISAGLQANYGADVGKPLTLMELVISGYFSSIGLFDEITEAQKKRAMEWLDYFGLADFADRNMARLSYGQLRKGFIARALAPDPAVLLLDEPLAGLDHSTRNEVYHLLEKVAQAGVRMVYITHHSEELIPSITNIIELEDGKISFCGKRTDYEKGRV
jgi:molybdate transport system ATP-binding protein